MAENRTDINRGKDKDGPYYKWEEKQGKKYHYTAGDSASRERAKEKAEKQRKAAAAASH